MTVSSPRSLRRAAARAAAAGGSIDVAAMQAELERLRALRAGTYALMMELVHRAGGGPIEIERAAWKAPPPGRRLKVQVDEATSDVTLFIEEGVELDAGPSPLAAAEEALSAG